MTSLFRVCTYILHLKGTPKWPCSLAEGFSSRLTCLGVVNHACYPVPTFSGFSCTTSAFCSSYLGLGSTLEFCEWYKVCVQLVLCGWMLAYSSNIYWKDLSFHTGSSLMLLSKVNAPYIWRLYYIFKVFLGRRQLLAEALSPPNLATPHPLSLQIPSTPADFVALTKSWLLSFHLAAAASAILPDAETQDSFELEVGHCVMPSISTPGT